MVWNRLRAIRIAFIVTLLSETFAGRKFRSFTVFSQNNETITFWFSLKFAFGNPRKFIYQTCPTAKFNSAKVSDNKVVCSEGTFQMIDKQQTNTMVAKKNESPKSKAEIDREE